MTGLLARLLIRLIGALPLGTNHALGALLGWLAWVLPTRGRQVARINLNLCYPKRDARWRKRTARRSLLEVGKTLTEAAWVWSRPAEDVLSRVVEVKGEAAIRAAVESGRGVIFASPHLGNWEVLTLYITRYLPMTNLYRPPRLAGLDTLIRQAREGTGATLVPTTPTGIKALKRALNRHESIGILPDQTPRRGQGVFAPWFGQPAYTMTLLPRLAAQHQAAVIVGFAERLPGGRFRIHALRVSDAVNDPDPAVSAAALNRSVEALIRTCPEQYAWNYKRFKIQPESYKRPY
ncbi:MAG: lipid A biosynthesis acyltransferase [Gammaproteobacteria bacterium]|jgi:KDO2-lipid IV(A) lauroyltransferase